MTTTTVRDTRIRMRASKQLLKLFEENKVHFKEVPENIEKILKSNDCNQSSKVEIIKGNIEQKSPEVDLELLRRLLSSEQSTEKRQYTTTTTTTVLKEGPACTEENGKEFYLYLSDIRWLNNKLAQLRKEQGLDIYLHSVLETCILELPQNEVLERNPELEARCQLLRDEQQNREYRKMTKNVDASLKNFPEDTIAYQIKALNSQIIAVLQFVFSVAAGFVFGFLGIELIVGNLDFGFRLLLGIMFALIIALAEIYFLAKKLNEYDNTVNSPNITTNTPEKNKKHHHHID